MSVLLFICMNTVCDAYNCYTVKYVCSHSWYYVFILGAEALNQLSRLRKQLANEKMRLESDYEKEKVCNYNNFNTYKFLLSFLEENN